MITFFNIMMSIVIPTFTGYAVISFISKRKAFDLTFKLSLSYGLGLGLLSLWMFSLVMLKIPFSVLTIELPLFFFSICLLLLSLKIKCAAKTRPDYAVTKSRPYKFSEKLLFAFFITYIAINIFFVFARTISFPIISWDAYTTIAFKAKIFYFERTVPNLNYLPHKTYPLFVPLSECWVALNLGHWSEIWIKIIFPFFFLSYLIIHFKFLEILTNKMWALFGCAILISSNFLFHHATISYRDLALMYFNCTTIILLLYWMREKDTWILFLSSLFAGLATFTKLEGSSFMAIYLVIFAIINFSNNQFGRKEKIKNFIIFLMPALAICCVFFFYKAFHSVLQDGVGYSDKTKIDFTIGKLKLIPQIIISFLKNMFFTANWGIVWIGFFISLYRGRRHNSMALKLLFIAIALFFTNYAAVSLFTKNYIWITGSSNTTTLSRLLLHFFPLVVISIILLNYFKPDKDT